MSLKSGLKRIGSKAFEILKGIAPIAASAVGGPYAGAAISIIAKTVGVDEDKIDDYILAASPEQLLKLKQAEIAFDQWREEAGIRRDELDVQDRVSARNLAKERGVMIQASLSISYTFAFFGVLYLFMTGKVVHIEHYESMLNSLVGALSAVQIQILNFWFGSSRGSKEKTEAMAQALKSE